MREIKFRAWNPTAKRMIKIADKSNDTALWIDENGFYVMDHFTGKPEAIGSMIDGLELMQYTGENDNNGTEIYEGDVVKVYSEEEMEEIYSKHKIVFSSGMYEFSPTLESLSFDGYIGLGGLEGDGRYCEVIGNVYEHPELLEVK